jgi:RNA polymerase sigma-70 factor, ECF subfamily
LPLLDEAIARNFNASEESMTSLPKMLLNPLAASDVPEDAALVSAALRSPDAFAVLYQQHVEGVYRYLLVRTSSIQDAQDLTAQTFMAAMHSLKLFRGDGRFAAWLIGIARRQVAMHFRSRKPLISLEAADALPDPTASPDDLAAQSVQTDQVIAAVRALPADRAEVVALRSFAELSVPEIAHVMGKSEPAIRMLLHRAIGDLRNELGTEE